LRTGGQAWNSRPHDPAEEKVPPMTVELIMQVSRSEDNRLTGTVRRDKEAGGHGFSGTLELMRVFEELVPADPDGSKSHSSGEE
jgi:hypothetical protein